MTNITVEMIEARLEKLRAIAEQMKANVSAYQGAIEDCEHWLEVLGKEQDGEAIGGDSEQE